MVAGPLIPLPGQQGGQQTRVGGLGGMEVLGLRGIGKDFPKPGRPGCRPFRTPQRFAGVEAKDASGGGGGPEGSHGTGCVPEFVVRAGLTAEARRSETSYPATMAVNISVPGIALGKRRRRQPTRSERPGGIDRRGKLSSNSRAWEAPAFTSAAQSGSTGFEIAHPQSPAGSVIDPVTGRATPGSGASESGTALANQSAKSSRAGLLTSTGKLGPVQSVHEARILFRQGHGTSPVETIL